MNVFLAFVVLAGSVLPLFLINLQTVPLALSAAAAAAVLVRTLIQKPAIWVPLHGCIARVDRSACGLCGVFGPGKTGSPCGPCG